MSEEFDPIRQLTSDVSVPSRRKASALIDAWPRAAGDLSAGQIYLLDSPLLREPLQLAGVATSRNKSQQAMQATCDAHPVLVAQPHE